MNRRFSGSLRGHWRKWRASQQTHIMIIQVWKYGEDKGKESRLSMYGYGSKSLSASQRGRRGCSPSCFGQLRIQGIKGSDDVTIVDIAVGDS